MEMQEKATLLINLFYPDSGMIYPEGEMNFSAHWVAENDVISERGE